VASLCGGRITARSSWTKAGPSRTSGCLAAAAAGAEILGVGADADEAGNCEPTGKLFNRRGGEVDKFGTISFAPDLGDEGGLDDTRAVLCTVPPPFGGAGVVVNCGGGGWRARARW